MKNSAFIVLFQRKSQQGGLGIYFFEPLPYNFSLFYFMEIPDKTTTRLQPLIFIPQNCVIARSLLEIPRQGQKQRPLVIAHFFLWSRYVMSHFSKFVLQLGLKLKEKVITGSSRRSGLARDKYQNSVCFG